MYGISTKNMRINRGLVCAAIVSLWSAFLPSVALAQEYPSKPIKLVVPFAPGGVTDTSGRIIAEALSKRLGQQVVVENKPGASGNIGAAQVAQASPDGYTLLLGFDGTLAINPHVFSKLGFDPMKDFAPITKIGDATIVLVAHPSVPAKDLKALIAYSKTVNGGLSYGTSGNGGTPHIAGELLKQKSGIVMTHVPYKGGGQALQDVLGGNIPLVYTAIAGALPHIKAGKVIPIAVSSDQRDAALPHVPTMKEVGFAEMVADSWVALLTPANTPRAIIDRLQKETAAALAQPEVRERLLGLGITPVGNTPELFGAQLRADIAKYESVVKAAGIRAE
jgi:tripartite-type tricarboxylate transporter receptor subunit TctC